MSLLTNSLHVSRGSQSGDAATDSKIAALAQWAQHSGIEQPLGCVLRACRACEPFHVNAVLQFLVLPSAGAVLREWLSDDSDWAGLVVLADHLLGAPHILELFPALQRARQQADEHDGQVRFSHIPLCLASRHPPGDADFSLFFEQLRVWLVIQGFKRAQLGKKVYDRRIDTAADWLRKGADRVQSRRVLEWLEDLRCSPEDDEAMSRLLLWKIEGSQATDERTRFFSSLRKIAEGRNSDNESDEHSVSAELTQIHGWADLPPGPGSSPGGLWLQSDPLATDDQESAESLHSCPSEMRVLSGRGLRILSVEALQFLPWSWHVPTPIEQSRLWTLVESWRMSDEAVLRVLAFQIQVAILTSRSLKQAQSIRVSDHPLDDWTFTRDGRSLHRLPPRPLVRNESQTSWATVLRPLLKTLVFDIAESRPPSRDWPTTTTPLLHAWIGVSPNESADALFGRKCAEINQLRRLSAGSLEYVLASSVYQASSDAVLAQMISSGYRAAFGGNCSYASWTLAGVKAASERIPCDVQLIGAEEANAAGSELDPSDEQLRSAIDAAGRRIGQLAEEPRNWVGHHNAVVTYVVAALLAATGARPVSDPFECAADIDWEQNVLWVADKISPGRTGRLVPLPPRLVQLLSSYREHLLLVSAHTVPGAAELAREIQVAARGSRTGRLPFLFFLRQDTVGWYSVTEASLRAQGIFEWKVPWNVMRHRFSTRLRAAGVDAEIIDSLLGHADRGVLTHGDYSARSWQADMTEAAPMLIAAYEALGFSTQLPLARNAILEPLSSADTEYVLPKELFGNQRREARRRRELQRQKEVVFALAREVIPKKDGKSRPEELDRSAWSQLVNKVRTRDGVHLHPYASWRYAVLRRLAGFLARKHPLHLGGAFAAEAELHSPFRVSAIGCKRKLIALRAWFAGAPCHPQNSKLRACQLLTLAAADLVLFSRITCWPMLRDVLSGDNCKIVIKDQKTFLEHHRTLDVDDHAPVQRFRISRRCAAWLGEAFSARDVDAGTYALRPTWRNSWPIAELGQPPSDSNALVRFAAELVEQENFLELPGLIAGYRAGRVLCHALPHAGWLLDDDAVLLHGLLESDTLPPEPKLVVLPSELRYWKPPKADAIKTEAASRMVTNIYATLEEFEKGRKDPDLRMRRSEVADGIRRAVAAENGAVSSAVWCFGRWLYFLAKRNGRTADALAPSSIDRYLNSLSARFLDVGANFNLLAADAAEITDFYETLLDHHRDLDIRFVANRLREFHEYMRMYHNACSIDWSSIDCGQVIAHFSPGLVGLRQYQNSLRLLVPEIGRANGEQVAAAFLLLLSYRFGLRGADGVWLRARDWHELNGSEVAGISRVVSVQSYWRRKTKRLMTRRIVPQLEAWDQFEHDIVRRFMAPFADEHRRNPEFALFANDRDGKLFDVHRLTDLVNGALSTAHGGECVTEHKARHGFADRVGCALLSAHVRPPWRAGDTTDAQRHILRTLVGTLRPTRRIVWAFGRAMGHAAPPVTFASYFHRLGTWSDEWSELTLDALDRAHGAVAFTNVIDLDLAKKEPWVVVAPRQAKEPDPASMKTVKDYLGYLRRGFSSETAAQYAGLPFPTATAIDHALAVVSARLSKRDAGRKSRREPLHCLARDIPETEWQIVRARSKHLDDSVPAAQEHLPASLEQAIELVSDERQLMMWKENHFHWVTAFVAALKLDSEDLSLICTGRVGGHTAQWSEASGLSRLFTVQKVPAMYVGRPPPLSVDGVRARVMDRFALRTRRGGEGSRLHGYALVLLWVIYSACFAQPQKITGGASDLAGGGKGT